jgi:hypothetical protein
LRALRLGLEERKTMTLRWLGRFLLVGGVVLLVVGVVGAIRDFSGYDTYPTPAPVDIAWVDPSVLDGVAAGTKVEAVIRVTNTDRRAVKVVGMSWG